MIHPIPPHRGDAAGQQAEHLQEVLMCIREVLERYLARTPASS
jgi:hypothetical protein